MQIPQNITKGTLQFYLDGQEIDAKVLQNNRISFVTLEFAGNGTHTLEIIGDVSAADLPELPDKTTKFDQLMVIAAVVGIVVAVGAGSTIAFYVKRKKSS
jgi:hypothetical protein